MVRIYRPLVTFAAIVALALAGCSGGGRSVIPPATGGTGTAVLTPAADALKVTIRIPATGASAAARKPAYVSPSTNGIAITVYPALATPPPSPTAVADVSASSPNCTNNPDGSRTCQISVQAPIGNDFFIVTTYDQVPAGGVPQGAQLSTATLQYQVRAGQVNTLPLTLNGIIATVVLGPTGYLVPASPQTLSLSVNAKDADGNIIIGPGNYSSPISLSISGDPNGTTTLSLSQVTSPATSALTINYNGGNIATVTITGAAAGAISATTTLQRNSSGTGVQLLVPGYNTQAFYYVSNADSVLRFAANANFNVTPTSSLVSGLNGRGIALDNAGNLITADSNQGINIYAPGSSTPARTIAGNLTQMCFPNGVVADASTNIYVIDSCNKIEVFAAGASGNVAPLRVIQGAATGLNNPWAGSFDAAGNLYVTSRQNFSVVEFAPGAGGNVAPVATISGAATLLPSQFGPEGIAVDSAGNINVSVLDNGGNRILSFAPGANGNVAPAHSNTGSQACAPVGLAVDSARNVYAIGNYAGCPQITEFSPGADGNAIPLAVITGPATGLGSANSEAQGIAVDSAGNIYASNSLYDTITVYAPGANGNAAPTRTIARGMPTLSGPRGVAFDAAQNMYIANQGSNSVAVFAGGASGNIAPLRTVQGNATGLQGPSGLTLDTSGNLYVANQFTNSVAAFAPGASGNVTPAWSLAGAATGLSQPQQIATDPSNNLYVANKGNDSVTVYPAGARGNAGPSSTLSGANTGISMPMGVWVDSQGTIYVANGFVAPNVAVFAPGANGNVAPLRTIAGANTFLNGYGAYITVDNAGFIYVNNAGCALVFAPGAAGNVAPIRNICGPSGLNGGWGIAISPTQP